MGVGQFSHHSPEMLKYSNADLHGELVVLKETLVVRPFIR
jgi:hypothetical protein